MAAPYYGSLYPLFLYDIGQKLQTTMIKKPRMTCKDIWMTESRTGQQVA
jgi:hypothetical protein